MRAPGDVTEGSRVGLQKEDGGVTPLGEQLTPFSSAQGGVPLLPVTHLFSGCA